MTTGGGDYDSVLGRMSTDWQQGANRGFRIDVTVPPNSTARVHLPTTDAAQVREGRRSLIGHPDVSILHPQAGRLVVEIGSGKYRFTVSS